MIAFYMKEVHTKHLHLVYLQEGSVFVLGLNGVFLMPVLTWEVMLREAQRRWLYWDSQEWPC